MRKIVSFFGDSDDIFVKLNRQAAEYAQARGLQYEWAPQQPYDKADVVRRLREADAGIIDVEPYGADIFDKINESTQILVRFGVGYDKVDLAAASRAGIAVARTTGANTLGVAEMALSLMLACRRQLKRAQRQVDEVAWRKTVSNETIGATVGIVGFGSIGKALARLLAGFGCDIIAYDPTPDEEEGEALGVRFVDLDTLFETADAVSLHVPFTEETRNLVDARRLALMKPTAVVVNTSRGGIVNEEDLARALESGAIRGAGLDVFEREPLPASPLIGLDNALLSPHLSSQTEESLWRVYKMAIDIAADFFEGNPSPHILNKDYAEGQKVHR